MKSRAVAVKGKTRFLPIPRPRGPANFPPPWFAEGGRRRMDHGARKRAAEWRAYQAAWRAPIDQLECSAQRFYTLRRNVLGLNRKQTARLLRVSVGSVLNWEQGRHPVPFYAFLSLFLISDSQHYRLANEAWRDWDFVQYFNADQRIMKKVTCFINRKTGAAFTPDDLNRYSHQMARLAMLESESGAGRIGVRRPAPDHHPRHLKPSL